jgi:hypothetical protein
MSLKENVNSLHNSLVVKFGDINISEKSSKEYGNYLELSIIKEGREVKAIINKEDLESNTFKWKYYSNPISGDHLVERQSSVFGFCDDVQNIFDYNRFSHDYTENN